MNTLFLNFCLLLLIGSCNKEKAPAPETGTLEVKVSVGPLCGTINPSLPQTNNPCGLSDEDVDEIYGQYKVIVEKGNSRYEKKMDRKGVVSFELPADVYSVKVAPNPYPTPENKEPLAVTIMATQKSKLKIDIQTGVR